MIRHCDGTDQYLTDAAGNPCACGLTFDDVDHVVIYPHDRIVKLTDEQRDALLRAAYPDLRKSDTPQPSRPV